RKKLQLFADTLLASSARPLRLCFAAGAVCVAGGAAGMALSTYLFGLALAVPHLLSAVLLICGAQLFGIGLLGEYVFRGFEESAGVPVYIVREDTFCSADARPVRAVAALLVDRLTAALPREGSGTGRRGTWRPPSSSGRDPRPPRGTSVRQPRRNGPSCRPPDRGSGS